MILSLSRIAYVVRNQNMTEWMRVPAHRTGHASAFMSYC
jgi:hypothetical protein